jgi:hypothetical protein
MKYDSRFTTGNLITIVLVCVGALVTILQAVEHRNDQSVHQLSDAIVRKDEFREFRQEMNENFKILQAQDQRHFEILTERVDGLYD